MIKKVFQLRLPMLKKLCQHEKKRKNQQQKELMYMNSSSDNAE